MHKSHMIIVQYIDKYIDIYEAYSENYSFPSPKPVTSLNLIGYYEDLQYRYIAIEADYH